MSWWQRYTCKNGFTGSSSGTRKRLWFTNEEKDILKSYFDEDYELGDRRHSIAEELGVAVERVITWWANRKQFLKLKGIDIPRGTPTRPEPEQSSMSRRSLTPYSRDTTTKINDEHKSLLNDQFSEDPFPSLEKREEISEKTGLSAAQVYMWFYWKRKRNDIETSSPKKAIKNSPQLEKRLVSEFVPQIKLKERYLNEKFLNQRSNKWGFTHEQQIELNAIYEFNPNPSSEEREKLAEQFNLTRLKLYQWFYYKRKKDPNMSLDDSFESAGNQLVVDDRRENHKRMTLEQMTELEKFYCADDPTGGPLSDKKERAKIGSDIGLNERQVYQWYYRRVRQSGVELVLSRPKRYSTEKYRPLRSEYDINPTGGRLTTKSGRQEIAKEQGLTEQQVYMWYYNRATKDGHRVNSGPRSKFKDWQKEILKSHFEIDDNPLGVDLKKLISRTKLRRRQVYHWFREERRRRENREAPELDVWQEEMLESFFETNGNPSIDERTKLAVDTELNERKVNAWFKNRRNAQIMEMSNERNDEYGDEDNGSEIEDDDLDPDEDVDDDRVGEIEIKVEKAESEIDADYDNEENEVTVEKGQIEDWQKFILSAHWKKTQNPSGQLLDKILKQTKLKKFQIYWWFRQERSRLTEEAEEPGSSSRRLPRVILTDDQLKILLDYYENKNQYPTRSEMKALSRKIDVTRLIVKRWFVERRRTHMYPLLKLHRVDCSQLTHFSQLEIRLNSRNPPEQETMPEKPPEITRSEKVPEPESDIESNNGSSFCDPIHTPHFESDSEPSKEPESKPSHKLLKARNESEAPKPADPRSIDPDGKLSKFFERNPYPKRTHIVDLGKFTNVFRSAKGYNLIICRP